MKPPTPLAISLAITLQITCAALAAPPPGDFSASVAHPATWQASAYRGETVAISAQLTGADGRPFAVPAGAEASMLWSTNGVDWFEPRPATVTTGGLVRATWTPDMDCGADSYRIFLRVDDGGASNINYRANMLLRMLGSPGANPSELPLPAKTIDFSAVAVSNAPWIEAESDPVFGAVSNGYLRVGGGPYVLVPPAPWEEDFDPDSEYDPDFLVEDELGVYGLRYLRQWVQSGDRATSNALMRAIREWRPNPITAGGQFGLALESLGSGALLTVGGQDALRVVDGYSLAGDTNAEWRVTGISRPAVVEGGVTNRPWIQVTVRCSMPGPWREASLWASRDFREWEETDFQPTIDGNDWIYLIPTNTGYRAFKAVGTLSPHPDSALSTDLRLEFSDAIPEDAAKRGVTWTDSHGDTHRGAVEIGEGARARVSPASMLAAPSNTVVRSVSVAIGPGADATDPSNPLKHQAIAIGNQSRATAVNSIAIGSGVKHADETDLEGGGNACASAPQAIALGYSAKSIAEGAMQIGNGVNDEAHTLKFEGVTVVRNGRVATDGTDTNTVASMIQAEVEKGVMYGSTHRTNVVDEATGTTNTWHYLRMEGVNEVQGSDPVFVLAMNADTNSPYACTFPLYPGSPNRREIYSAQTIDRIIAGLARRDELLADLRGYATSGSVDVRYGSDAAEGATLWSCGAERNVCFAWWQRWDAPVPQQAMPVTWLMSSMFSAAPARSTSEGGPELPGFLRVEDVPLDANGYWATNCVPQDALDIYGGTSGDFVVCANVTTDVALTLSIGGTARELAASNAMQTLNFQVPRGDASVSVQAADAGGAVSLALAVNPWTEYKHSGDWGPQNGSMEHMMPGGTNTWTMFAWRLDYDGAGTVRSRISALTDSGDWEERTNTVSGLCWGARMPENIRFRTVFSSMYGGLQGHEVWRYGLTRVLSGEVDDAALVRWWRRGKDDLSRRGLWNALPANGGTDQ